MIVIPDQAALEALPDGTTITWERIPGDSTSRAVAFVHTDVDPDAPTRDTARVTWVSPGGWDPKSPEDAGVTYPAHVVVYGDLTEWLFDGGAPIATAEGFMPDPPLFTALEATAYPLISGGTWPRESALAAAARVFGGKGTNRTAADTVLAVADQFVAWLERP